MRFSSNVMKVSSIGALVALLISLAMSKAAVAAPSLTITGSDTLAPLVTTWLQAFKGRYPGLRVEMQSTGSATVPTALAEGTVDIGAMSRRMTREELNEFIARRGFTPQSVAIARDALVVIVNKQNPITRLTLDQLDRVFSANARCSGDSAIRDWRQLDAALSYQPPQQRVVAFSRTATSGSYGFFKSRVLCDGDYATHVVEFEGFAALVDSVATTPGGIGYTGLHWVDERVKPLELSAASTGSSGLESSDENYPLTRDMFFYWAQVPGTQLSPIHCAFIQYSQSAQAQAMVASLGFTPVNSDSQNSPDEHALCN